MSQNILVAEAGVISPGHGPCNEELRARCAAICEIAGNNDPILVVYARKRIHETPALERHQRLLGEQS